MRSEGSIGGELDIVIDHPRDELVMPLILRGKQGIGIHLDQKRLPVLTDHEVVTAKSGHPPAVAIVVQASEQLRPGGKGCVRDEAKDLWQYILAELEARRWMYGGLDVIKRDRVSLFKLAAVGTTYLLAIVRQMDDTMAGGGGSSCIRDSGCRCGLCVRGQFRSMARYAMRRLRLRRDLRLSDICCIGRQVVCFRAGPCVPFAEGVDA